MKQGRVVVERAIVVGVSVWVVGCVGGGDAGVECSSSQWNAVGFTETYTYRSGDTGCIGESTSQNRSLMGRDDTDPTWDCRIDSETFSNNECTRTKTSTCLDPSNGTRVYTTTSVITQRDSEGEFYDGTSTFNLDAFSSIPSCSTTFDVTYERE